MEHLNDKQEAERASWQYRAIAHTRGPNSQTGAILLAALGKSRDTRPQLGPSAAISSDGWVVTVYIDRQGKDQGPRAVCTVDDMTGNFSRLADDLRLADHERIEMFQKVRSWVSEDHRIDKQLHFSIEQRLGR